MRSAITIDVQMMEKLGPYVAKDIVETFILYMFSDEYKDRITIDNITYEGRS